MPTYTVTVRSTLYTSYEIEAEDEAQAREIAENEEGLSEVHSWTEDTETAWVDAEDE